LDMDALAFLKAVSIEWSVEPDALAFLKAVAIELSAEPLGVR